MKSFIILSLSALLLWQCKSKDEGKAVQVVNLDTTLVVVAKPRLGDLTSTSTVIGVITNGQEAKPSFKTGGVIASTYFDEGDYVKKGQLLARLNMAEIEAQLSQATEALAKSERDLGRARRLYADSVATLEQVQNAGTAVELAKKTREIVLFNKQYSEVRSPIDGRIVKQILHAGEMAGPGMPVYAIVGTVGKDWRVKAGFTDKEWYRLKKGQKGEFTLDANPGVRHQVILTEKAVIAGNASSLVDAEFTFVRQPENLAIGLLGKLTVASQSEQGTMTLPVECLTQSSGNTSYLYVNDNGVARQKKIKTGQILGDRVQVLEGVGPDDEVITTGAMYLEDGDKIKINR